MALDPTNYEPQPPSASGTGSSEMDRRQLVFRDGADTCMSAWRSRRTQARSLLPVRRRDLIWNSTVRSLAHEVRATSVEFYIQSGLARSPSRTGSAANKGTVRVGLFRHLADAEIRMTNVGPRRGFPRTRHTDEREFRPSPGTDVHQVPDPGRPELVETHVADHLSGSHGRAGFR